MTIASLIVQVGANTVELQKSVEQVHGKLDQFAGVAKTAGAALAAAFSVNAIAGAAREAVNASGAIQDAAERIGISAESVQKLSFAAEQGGGSLEGVATAIGKMAQNLSDPSKGTVALIESLGLKVSDLQAMAPDEAFTAIADAIGKMPDPLKQSDAAVELLGKGSLALLPAMKDGFRAVGEAAPVMANQTVAAGARIGDTWNEVQTRIDNLKAQALIPLLDVFSSMPASVQVAAGALAQFTPSLGGLATAVMAAGGPSAAFTALAGIFTTTLPAAFGAVLPFLGPIGIIAVAVGAVWAVWKNWETIVDFAKGVYTGVKTWIVDTLVPLIAEGGPLLGPVGAVITIWRNWEQITGIAQRVYQGVKEWLVDKFAAVVNAIREKVGAVTGFFRDMYDKVVGNSFVPDMIARIEQEFGRLQSVMVDPAGTSIGTVMQLFSAGFTEVQSIFRDFTDGARTLTQNVAGYFSGMAQANQGVMRVMAGDVTGWKDVIIGTLRQVMSAIGAVRNAINHLRGGEEGILVNPARDKFLAQFGPGGTGEGSGFFNLATLLTELTGEAGGGSLFEAMRAADTMAEFTAAIERIEEALRNAGRLPGSSSSNEDGFSRGTPGLDYGRFGSGTRAMLHGDEAVIPRNRVGEFAAQVAAYLSGGEGPATVIVNGEQFDGYIIRKTRGAVARGEIPVPESSIQRQVSFA